MKEMVKKWGLFSVVLLLSILLMIGCGTQEQDTQDKGGTTSNDKTEEVAQNIGEEFPVTITDDANQEVTIEAEPETIVSIQASNTEIAFALGLGDKIIGVSDYDNYPKEALEIQKVGAQDINAELVLSLLPDIALVTDYHYETHPDVLQKFEEAGIDVIVVGSATSFEDTYSNIEMIGAATGSKKEAEEVVTDMKERLQAIKDKAEAVKDKKKVWVEVSPGPDIFTTGQNTFMHEMLESIHATNAAEDQEGWVKMTEEEIVQLDPDVIITTYGYYVENPTAEVLGREGWAEVPAVKNGNVFDVDSDTVTRPGPRLIEGVETLAELIYPELLNNKIGGLYILSGGLLLGTSLLGLFYSSVTVPVPTILHILFDKMFSISLLDEVAKNEEMIIWNIRLPRVLLAFCVGASLALAGAAFQGLLRNPLADPYTIGVSSGASLGAVLVLFFQVSIVGLGSFTLPIVSIISGFIALLVVFGLVRLSSRSLAIETIILAGVIVSAFISAVVSLLISLGDRDAMTQIIYWLYGSVGMRGWNYVELIFPFMIIGACILFYHSRELNAMALGEEAADHIGVNVKKGKTYILIGASLLTGASVAVSGSIGFVGLVIPHLVRLVTGPNHRHVLPLSMLTGGSFLILADLVARTIIAPQELPIGVITALIGAPVFALLLVRERIGKGISR